MMVKMKHYYSLLVCVLIMRTAISQCPESCSCRHHNGRYGAICTQQTQVPTIAGNVMELDLDDGNQLHDRIVDDDYFFRRQLDSLRVLRMRHCSISVFGPNVFRNMEILETLDVSFNKLPDLPEKMFSELTHLKHLKLAHNNLSTIRAMMFEGATGIQTLDLSSNQITHINRAAFRGMPRLNQIDLTNNRLVRLNVLTFQPVYTTLQILSLEGNRWACDCGMREFVAWHLKKKFQPARCSDPDRFKMKSWESMSPKEFACAPYIQRHRLQLQTTADRGHSVQFLCPVGGDPEPFISWEFSHLQNKSRQLLDNLVGKYTIIKKPIGQPEKKQWDSILRIDDVQVGDAGQYVCVASNSADKLVEVYQLDIKGGKKYEAAPQPRPTAIGPTVRITGDMIMMIVILIAAILIVAFVLLIVLCFRRTATGSTADGDYGKPTYVTGVDTYAYQAIETNGKPYLENYYVSAPGQASLTVLPPPPPPPISDRAHMVINDHDFYDAAPLGFASNQPNYNRVVTFSDSIPSSVQQDDSGYLEPGNDSPPVCSLHSSSHYSPNGPLGSDEQNIAPLADSELDCKVPLKETAL